MLICSEPPSRKSCCVRTRAVRCRPPLYALVENIQSVSAISGKRDGVEVFDIGDIAPTSSLHQAGKPAFLELDGVRDKPAAPEHIEKSLGYLTRGWGAGEF